MLVAAFLEPIEPVVVAVAVLAIQNLPTKRYPVLLPINAVLLVAAVRQELMVLLAAQHHGILAHLLLLVVVVDKQQLRLRPLEALVVVLVVALVVLVAQGQQAQLR